MKWKAETIIYLYNIYGVMKVIYQLLVSYLKRGTMIYIDDIIGPSKYTLLMLIKPYIYWLSQYCSDQVYIIGRYIPVHKTINNTIKDQTSHTQHVSLHAHYISPYLTNVNNSYHYANHNFERSSIDLCNIIDCTLGQWGQY